MNKSDPQFFGGLESLRGVAALLVVLYHIEWPNPLTHRLLINNSYLLVDFFFVLSGFIICHNYQSKVGSAGEVARFIWLRLGRLYPLHLFVLVVFLGIETLKYFGEARFGFIPHYHHAFDTNNTSSFVAHLLLVHPFFPFAKDTFNVPSWSIGVEFYTYVVFALIALIARRKRELSMVACLLVLLSAFFLYFFKGGSLREVDGSGFVRCLLGFFSGVLAYQLFDRPGWKSPRWAATLQPCLAVFLAGFLSLNQNPQWDCVLVPSFALLVMTVAAPPRGPAGFFSNPLHWAPLRWLGKVSYSIYMVHMLVLMLVRRVFVLAQDKLIPNGNPGLARSCLGLIFVLLAIGLVLIISRFTHQWIEVACQKKLRHLTCNQKTVKIA